MRRLYGFILVLALAFALPAFSQQRWERNYGGTGADEEGYSVQQTFDGGYIVTGSTNGAQFYLVKTNATGDTLWTRAYGGAGSDEGYSVQQTSDGGYILAGVYDIFGSNHQVYLVKTNASGDTLWTRDYGGSGRTAFDYGRSVQQTSEGGYIVAGYTYSFGNSAQFYLIKTNATGDTLWTRTYGGLDIERGYSVQQTSDGGYIVAGETFSFGNFWQVYLIKTNATGDTLWTRNYGGASDDWGRSVQQTTDGGYIVAGYTNSYGNWYQVYLIKTNASGDTLWTRTYGGTEAEEGFSVRQTTEGGYIVAGYTPSFGNGIQVYLIKTNAGGDTLWTRTYGGAGDDRGYSVRQTSDGGYIVAGETNSFGNGGQVYLIKTNANGSSGVEEARNAEFGMRNAELRITPNPFTSFATLPGHEAERFSLYDVSGRKVGTYQGDRVGEGLAPGVYFLRQEGKYAEPLRIVKIR
jgi:uncharacterized delta-60 repeat protein